MRYYVVMCDYPHTETHAACSEAVVNMDTTLRNVIDGVRNGEYKRVRFIHYVYDGSVEDVTDEILQKASEEASHNG